MGLFGDNSVFVGGTAALAFLLAAEVVAATAAVSEAALVYVARHRNLLISALMIATQAALTVGIILAMRSLPLGESRAPGLSGGGRGARSGAGARHGLDPQVAAARPDALAAPVQGWRWSLVWAAAAASVVGFVATLLPEWLELSLGAPLILVTFGMMVWYRGFTAEDRTLFRRQGPPEEPGLPA